jgi:prolyl-tRNA editing enzyme YbaK/EbsC (Cys-tRNA(Pro) deacylase)
MPSSDPRTQSQGTIGWGPSEVGRRVAACVAVLIVSAGCAGNASPTPIPTSTPAPAATASVTPMRTATPGAATPIGELAVGRQIQTATRLADGRVLVAGGYDAADVALASADLYDPPTGAFRRTGPLAVARGYDTATRLVDGRILIAGGNPHQWQFDGPFLASAELYDPQTGTFSPTGSLATARNLHSATRLADGRVLMVGGNDTGTHSLAVAELYDPKSGTFSPTGSLAMARGFHTATRLADGRVLIVGGTSVGWNGPPFLASAEIYDPKTGRFAGTRPMAVARGSHTATLLADGRVLITGGTDIGTRSLASAELYDPKTGTFSATGLMTAARTFHEATLLADGRVLVTGGDPAGWSYDGPFLASAEIYDPKTGAFAATGQLATARTYHTATLLADGRVLVAAGYGDLGPLASAETYHPATGQFSPAG